MLGYCPRGEHAVAGRRLQPGRRLPGQGALPPRGARRLHRRHRGVAAQRVQLHGLRAGPRGRGRADVALPFGGVPFGVKELEKVAGWPYTAGVGHLQGPGRRPRRHVGDAACGRTGAVLAAQTTAPEFGGINCTSTELHGTTRNPVEPRAHARRIVGRHRGRRRRRPAADRHGQRRRRVDPRPGRLQRPVRAEGDLRADPQGPRRHDRADDDGARAASPARCATRRATSTPATGSTGATRSACPGSRDGRRGSARYDLVGHDGGHRGGPRDRPRSATRWPARRGRGGERLAAAAGLASRRSCRPRCRRCVAPGPWRTSHPWSPTSATPTLTGSASSRARSQAGLDACAGALRPRAGGLHRALPPPAQRGHGRPSSTRPTSCFCSTHPDVAFEAEGPPPSTLPGATSSTRSASPAPS